MHLLYMLPHARACQRHTLLAGTEYMELMKTTIAIQCAETSEVDPYRVGCVVNHRA